MRPARPSDRFLSLLNQRLERELAANDARRTNPWRFLGRVPRSILSVSLQVSQYCFATCSYREKKSEPTEMMPLEGYTVDYAEPDNGKSMFLAFPIVCRTSSNAHLHGNKYHGFPF